MIVGRGSAYYLRDQPDSFHVFIYAPFEEKVRRLQQAERARKKRSNWSRPWIATGRTSSSRTSESSFPARHFFHLMVNSTMGEKAAVQTVLDALSAVQTRP